MTNIFITQKQNRFFPQTADEEFQVVIMQLKKKNRLISVPQLSLIYEVVSNKLAFGKWFSYQLISFLILNDTFEIKIDSKSITKLILKVADQKMTL